MNYVYGAVALTGGGDGALDKIDGTDLADKDMAYATVTDTTYSYILDADSAAAESSPTVIQPDTNSGDKRWILTALCGTTAKLTNLTDGYVPYHVSDAAGLANSPIYTDGTNVGIGTTSPYAKLSVASTAALESAPLGSELLSSDGWTTTGWTGDFASGFTHTPGNTTALTNTLAAVTNNYYQIAFTVSGRTAGTFTITFGGVTSVAYSATSTTGPKAVSTGTLSITPTTNFDGKIIISIKQITGEYLPTYVLTNSAGNSALEIRSTTNGLYNSFIGTGAGRYNTTGYQNSAMGYASLYSNTTGYFNSAMGMYSLYSNTTGYRNSAMGMNAGRYITGGAVANATGNNSVFLGYDTRANADGETNQVVLGANTTGFGSNTIAYGNSSMTKHIFQAGNVGIGTTSPSVLLTLGGGSAVGRMKFDSPTGAGQGPQLGFYTAGTLQAYFGSYSGIHNSTATDIELALQSPNNFLITGGNVGIGTTAPSSILEIQGGLTTTGAVLTLGTKETTVVANDVLGRINFYAPLEADGSDAILPGASICAIATATFDATHNSTALCFQTANSETAVGQTRLFIGPTGNMGFNTTDIEAWSSSYNAFQLGVNAALLYSTSIDGIFLCQNSYYDGNWKRRTAGGVASSLIYLTDGSFTIRQAAADVIDSAIAWSYPFYVNKSGNAGFNTTDIEAWAAGYAGLELGGGQAIMYSKTGLGVYYYGNAYYDGASKYKTNNYALSYDSGASGHRFRVAASGVADATITWIDAFTVCLTGGVCVGGTTDPGDNNLLVIGTLHTDGAATLASVVCEGTLHCDGFAEFDEVVRFDDGFRSGGSEYLKIWTYTATLTADDITATCKDVTVTAVTLTNVRSLTMAFYDSDGGYVFGDSQAHASSYSNGLMFLSNDTVRINLQANAEAGDIVSVTIIEAILTGSPSASPSNSPSESPSPSPSASPSGA